MSRAGIDGEDHARLAKRGAERLDVGSVSMGTLWLSLGGRDGASHWSCRRAAHLSSAVFDAIQGH